MYSRTWIYDVGLWDENLYYLLVCQIVGELIFLRGERGEIVTTSLSSFGSEEVKEVTYPASCAAIGMMQARAEFYVMPRMFRIEASNFWCFLQFALWWLIVVEQTFTMYFATSMGLRIH